MNNQTRDIYEIFGINLKIVSFSSWILEFVKKKKKNLWWLSIFWIYKIKKKLLIHNSMIKAIIKSKLLNKGSNKLK